MQPTLEELGKDVPDNKKLRRSRSKKTNSSKSLRSFRGLITGKSRREKRKQRAEEKKAKLESETGDLDTSHHAGPALAVLAADNVDEETIYGANFDDTTVVSEAPKDGDDATALTTDALQIILLLMDPGTRRFELLQLEFDPSNSAVSDILTQIPLSATEETLRAQNFDCVCSTDGIEYDLSKPLAEYIDSTSVVIAAPKSDTVDARSAAKMAKPILTDPKVAQMLSSAGVSPPLLLKEPKKESVPAKEEVKKEEPPAPEQEKAPEEKKTPQDPTPAPITPEPVEAKGSNPDSAAIEPKPKSNFAMAHLFVGSFIAFLFYSIVSHQMYLTSPMQAGELLKPGARKSQCGLYPSSSCVSAVLEMGEDGILSYELDHKVVFSLIGNVCKEDDDNCVNGAMFEKDGSIKIGGASPKIRVKKGKNSLHPFPFANGVGTTNGRGTKF